MLFLFQLNLTAFVLAEDDLNLLQIDLNLSFLIDNINILYYVHQPLWLTEHCQKSKWAYFHNK